MAHTRFGKSLVVALAVLTRVTVFPEKWAIVAGSQAKAKIIMSYIIEHAFDNEFISSRLDVTREETKKSIQRERSKNRITFRVSEGRMGEVFVLSGDSSSKARAGEAVMGFGAPNLILDEAALVNDQIESKIFRMLGDNMDNFYCKIGNPFNRNHFYKSHKDPIYFKMNVDYIIGLQEGRLTRSFIEEARQKPNFGVLYENRFPESDAVDEKGWSPLLLDAEYHLALETIPKEAWIGIPVIGVDVARGGGCENVWTLRTSNFARVIAKSKTSDLMTVASTTVRLAKEYGVSQYNVFIDDNGVGGGVTDRLTQMRFYCHGVMAQERAQDKEMFINVRAEMAWKARLWIINGGKLDKSNDWSEALTMKYMAQPSSGKIKMMSKVEMQSNGLPSPDTWDSLALTFYREPYNKKRSIEEAKSEEYNNRDII